MTIWTVVALLAGLVCLVNRAAIEPAPRTPSSPARHCPSWRHRCSPRTAVSATDSGDSEAVGVVVPLVLIGFTLSALQARRQGSTSSPDPILEP